MSDVKQNGDFCWVELCTSDIKNALSFYEPLLGWDSQTADMPDGGSYTMLKVGENHIAGAFEINEEMKQQNIPPHWNSYVLVENVDKAAAKAEQLGGKILKPAFDVMEAGRMAVLADPTGATFSIWQAKNEPANTLAKNVPGMFGWNELATNDIEKATAFYSKLFGWQANTQEMAPGKTYTSFMNNDAPAAGMLALTEEWKGAPPHWGVYFTVSNLDDALAKATSAGAEMMYEPIEMPNVGRFTMVKDPQGVTFSIIQFAG